jgi:phenazine biosynthesis protein PhzF family
MERSMLHYDAFSATPGKGNPAGVVLHADDMSEREMQEAAARIGFNETAFLLESGRAEWRIRYFTPGHETDLCGHATIASVYCLYERGLLQGKEAIEIETAAGVLPVGIVRRDGAVLVSMRQLAPEFLPFEGDVGRLAAVLGISSAALHPELPIVYGSTGSWTLLVPLRSPDAFAGMRPQSASFPEVLAQMPRSSIHPFCFGALRPGRQIHSRHFSSPYSGTVEDPVTGTASGAIGCYCATYVDRARDAYDFTMEQGQEIGRDGEVFVRIERSGGELRPTVAGTAVYVGALRGL